MNSKLKGLTKSLEGYGREVRNILSTKSRHTVSHLDKLREIPDCKKYVAFDFTSTEIDAVAGRYLYYLFRDFTSAGYFPLFKKNIRFWSSFPHKRYKNLILDFPIATFESYNCIPKETILLTDHRKHNYAGKTILVDYQHRLCQGDREIALPFSCSPSILHKNLNFEELSQKHPRTNQVFFGGAAQRPKYASQTLSDKYNVVTRADALDQILEAINNKVIAPNSPLKLHYKPEDRIPYDQWMPTLGASEFFLALPGVEMPLSHNLIESLAVGTIPILQYPQYMSPPLIHDETCLVYHDKESLIDTIKSVFSMSPEKKLDLSTKAKTYYNTHLKLGCFANNLLNQNPIIDTIMINSYRVPRD